MADQTLFLCASCDTEVDPSHPCPECGCPETLEA